MKGPLVPWCPCLLRAGDLKQGSVMTYQERIDSFRQLRVEQGLCYDV